MGVNGRDLEAVAMISRAAQWPWQSWTLVPSVYRQANRSDPQCLGLQMKL